MWKKSSLLFFEGTIVFICTLNPLLLLQPHICDCQTHKLQQTVVGGGGNGHATALQQSSRYYADNNVQPPRNQLQQQYGGGGGGGGTGGRRHVPTADYNNENGNYWRYGDDGAAAAVATLMTDKTAVASTDSTAGSPVVVHGGSVQVVSPSLLSSPHVVRNVYENDDAAAVAFASPFSGDAPGPVALLRLLFGPELLHAINPLHDGGHKLQLSFCNRLAVVGRFLGRLLEPLFTTGFYMAASYFFRTTILPRIAQFLHVYTMSTMKDHNGGGGDDDDDDHHHHPHHDVVVGRSKSDDGPDSDPSCFRKLACEAGRRLVMQAVNDPIARSIRRVAKRIVLGNDLAHIFKESLTGSISECNQYSCKRNGKF